jgi:hypothetical protein
MRAMQRLRPTRTRSSPLIRHSTGTGTTINITTETTHVMGGKASRGETALYLYHFTRPEFLDAILRDGLKASSANLQNNMTGGRPVVWLTTRDSLVPTLNARRIMLARGLLCGPRYSNLPDATVCLRTVIGSQDRRLVHFLTWLRKHPNLCSKDPDDPLLQGDAADHWVYFGDIPTAKLSVFKHVPRGMVCWELHHHEHWKETGGEARFNPPDEDDLLAGREGPPEYVAACKAMGEVG